MSDKSKFVIKIKDIELHTPYTEDTYSKVKRLAAQKYSGKTMLDVANAFAAKLQQAFDAIESTVSESNPERNYWLVNVPIHRRFDNSESRVCISFYVTQD